MRKGILFGSFDVWHAGYALMIEDAKRECDFLIVGLQEENSKKTIVNTLHERFLVLRSIRGIDEIALYSSEEELINLLQFYRPDCRFLGDDYRYGKKKEEVKGLDYSGEIIYLDRGHGFSSRVFKNNIANYTFGGANALSSR
tara:strand:- start:18060 stop:18485 length:426 start_codon:yes stop_codon:yes gene_type:complete